MRNRVAKMASVLGLSLIMCACGSGVTPEQAGDGEGTIELAEFPDRPYWGDTHLHTDLSGDAFGFGVRLGSEEALRFARGEEVESTFGVVAQLARPLDFLVISDHSDGLGAFKRLYDAPRIALRDPTLRRWHDMMHESPEQSTRAAGEIIDRAASNDFPAAMAKNREETTRSAWHGQLDLIDQFNEPGVFTAMSGFEWTLMPQGNNLHRVVMFRDGSERTKQVLPYPGFGNTVEGLWDFMEGYARQTQGQVLAIPHNPNLSNGLMFEMTLADGSPMTQEYAQRRAQMEPVVEVTQIKGDSEAHPFLSPNDEFAGFGVTGWDKANLNTEQATRPEMYAGNYARAALKRGLTLERQLGANPYAFGMIGATDSHTAFATGDEDNFYGKHSGNEPVNTERANLPQNLGTREGRFGWHYLAGGYAAAWARGNTRAEIFDAFKRREVYATTGPRMVVRMFAGFDFSEEDWADDWVRAGYTRGVPMGGELTDQSAAPIFMISAQKDPDGANLDRVQVVKGWVDAAGEAQERVYDVVWSDMENRRPVNGKVPPVGDTVDRENASYTNTIGVTALRTVWTDPDYIEGQRAFYYLRVLEIPTPRWTLFDARRFGITLNEEAMADAVAQERAYSSPIWLKPAAE